MRAIVPRYRDQPLAATVVALALTLGAAITVLTVGLRAEFTDGIYRNQFDSLARSFSITKAQPHGTRATGIQSLRDADVAALQADLDPTAVEHVIPIAQGRAVLHRGTHGFSGGVIGGSQDYLSYMHTPLIRGSMFTAEHVRTGARVVLLGPGVVKALFPHDPDAALGSQVRVGRLTFTVIGLVGKDVTGGNSSISIAPVTTVRGDLLGGIRTVGVIGVVARSPATVSEASKEATEILERRHGARKAGAQNDFSITTFSSDRLALARPLIMGVAWFAIGVAGLCLLLATLGAAALHSRRRPPLRALLTETLAYTVVGTVLGSLAGRAMSSLLANLAPGVGTPRLTTPFTVAWGLGFGCAVAASAVTITLARARRTA